MSSSEEDEQQVYQQVLQVLIYLNGLPGIGKTTLGKYLSSSTLESEVLFYSETAHEDGLLELLFGGTLSLPEVLCQFQQIMFADCVQNVLKAIEKLKLKSEKQTIAIIDRCPDGNRVFALNSHYNSNDPLNPEITKDQLTFYEGRSCIARKQLARAHSPDILHIPIYLWADVETVIDRLKKRDAGSIEVSHYNPGYYWNLERVHFILMLAVQQSTFSKGNIIMWDDFHSQYDRFDAILEMIVQRTKEGLRPLKELKISRRNPKKSDRGDREIVIIKVSSMEELLSEPFIDRVMKQLVISSDRDKERLVWLKCSGSEDFTKPIYGQTLALVH